MDDRYAGKSFLVKFVLSLLVIQASIVSVSAKMIQLERPIPGDVIKILRDMIPDSEPTKLLRKEWISQNVAILDPVNNLTAILVKRPFREFPNVTILRFDKKWTPIYEVLGLGMGTVSGGHDLHTSGLAVDMSIQGMQSGEKQLWGDKSVVKMLGTTRKTGMSMSVYPRFFHGHPSGRYTYAMDRSQLDIWGSQLFKTSKEEWLEGTCAKYDLPELIGGEFLMIKGKYNLRVRTRNGQEWTVRFTGITEDGFLADKTIRANLVSMTEPAQFLGRGITYEMPEDPAVDEFRYAGGNIVCLTVDPEAKGYENCLRFGNIKIGSSKETAEKAIEEIGGSYQRELESKSGKNYLYSLPSSKGNKFFPYFVLNIQDERVVSIQLTGESTSANVKFAALTLGESEENVVEVLGPPRRFHGVPQIKGIMWNYKPFPITVEFVNGKIYSIRIAEH